MELGGPDYAKSGPKVRRTTEFRNETGDEKKILLLVRCCGAGRPRLRHVRPKAGLPQGLAISRVSLWSWAAPTTQSPDPR